MPDYHPDVLHLLTCLAARASTAFLPLQPTFFLQNPVRRNAVLMAYHERPIDNRQTMRSYCGGLLRSQHAWIGRGGFRTDMVRLVTRWFCTAQYNVDTLPFWFPEQLYLT